MRELSLHLVDIIQNSIAAHATKVEIEIWENINEDLLKISIKDNGCGIDEEVLPKVKDPFVTSRKTRRVGLGISLFEAACVRCEGRLDITSKVGQGTTVIGEMQYSHIDRMPIGRIEETIISALYTPNLDILYRHRVNDKEFIFDSQEIKKIVGEDLTEPEILLWIKEYIEENIKEINGEMMQ